MIVAADIRLWQDVGPLVLSAQVLRVTLTNERPELAATDQSEDGKQTILRQS